MDNKNNNTQFNILIVDDVPKNIQVAANILQNTNYNISFANDGKTALSIAGDRKFDLILLDIMMPEMDGFQVCEELKKEPKTKDTPVIFLTAKTDVESIVKGFETGASDYVTKPFNPHELAARVKTQLKLKLAYDELKRSEDDLRESNAAKDKLFSVISHDLKNSFTTIIGFFELILSKIDSLSKEKINHYLNISYKSTQTALSLLENLLNWARAQTGRIEFNPEKLKISKIVNDNVEYLKNDAGKKEIKLSFDFKDKKLFVTADRMMTATVLRNLISNAIKFTPRYGKIAAAIEETDKYAEIRISDTGIGMDKENLNNLFRIDVNQSTPGTENEKGTGLGLILCREFVEKQGGRIYAESEPGKGSCFVITLPKVVDKE